MSTLKQYMNSLKGKWDGVSRIGHLPDLFLGSSDYNAGIIMELLLFKSVHLVLGGEVPYYKIPIIVEDKLSGKESCNIGTSLVRRLSKHYRRGCWLVFPKEGRPLIKSVGLQNSLLCEFEGIEDIRPLGIEQLRKFAKYSPVIAACKNLPRYMDVKGYGSSFYLINVNAAEVKLNIQELDEPYIGQVWAEAVAKYHDPKYRCFKFTHDIYLMT